MNLEELQAFIAVVDHGSVLSAAEALGVARTTLRRRLDDLEARAGVPLLHRLASGAVATEAGQLLVDHGRRIVRESSAVLASVRELGSEPSGLVRVVAPPGMPPHVVVPLLLAIRARFPRLTLDVRFDSKPIAGLLTDVDLAVQLGATLPEGPWIAFVVHRVRERLVAGAEWVARHGLPTTLDALASHPVHVWAAPDREPGAIPLLGGGAFALTPALITTDIHALRQLALGGHGIALVPDAMLPDPGFDDDALVPVLPDLVGSVLALRIVVPQALVTVPKIKALVDEIRAVVDVMPS